jgi:hypothetical protein
MISANFYTLLGRALSLAVVLMSRRLAALDGMGVNQRELYNSGGHNFISDAKSVKSSK